MKVFILLAEYVFDCEPTVEVDVFSSYEKAKEAFNECVKDEKEHDHLIEKENCVIEQSENHFAVWEDGFYNQDHFCLDILEKKVK